ncbi:hypothetical protein A6R68_04722 [Neotoma lepida]|uniref:Uncharacterized protein n=1 Tax=Neotoma lepida TaxID=56216 RepID=A0A1A6GLZ2_NEOLE|nr:hypothetical protein A6R68_04722 [Neotoma lepida]
MVLITEVLQPLFSSSRSELILNSESECKNAPVQCEATDLVIYCARLNNISVVECLLPEEVSLVQRITGLPPCVLPQVTSQCEISDSTLVKFCKPLILRSKRYVHLGLVSTCVFIPHRVILCGPVWVLFNNTRLFTDLDLNYIIQTKDQRDPSPLLITIAEKVITCQKVSGHNNTELKPHMPWSAHKETSIDTFQTDEILKCLSPEKNRIIDDCELLIENNPTGNPTAEDTRTETSYENVQVTHNPGKGYTLPVIYKSLDTCTSQGYCSSTIPAGCVLPVGDLAALLSSQLCQKCRQSDEAMVSMLIADALLGIPKILYKPKKGKDSFPHVYMRSLHALQTSQPMVSGQSGLEPVTGKYQLLTSVLQCLMKVLTIGLIINIKRQLQKIGDQDSDDEL